MSSTNSTPAMTTTVPTPATPPREKHVSSYTALTKSVQNAGLLRRTYGYYWTKLIGVPLIGLGLAIAFVFIGDTWWQMVTAAGLALLMAQAAFLSHDAAHRQIFVSRKWNEWISLIVMSLFVGMGYGWWQRKHSKHHASPNKLDADPDIEPGPLAFTAHAAEKRKSPLTRWLATKQGYFFYPLLLLEGINLHFQGIKRAVRRGRVKYRWVELSFIGVRLVSFIGLAFLVLSPGKAAAFIGVQLAIFGLYMGLSFAPNHVGMPVVPADMKIDFLRRQVLMSRNITGGPAMDVFMGGLNFQVEHHLFPSMPRPHLRKVAPMVQQYCENLGVRYTQTSLAESYRAIFVHLNRVGRGGLDVWACPLATQLRS